MSGIPAGPYGPAHTVSQPAPNASPDDRNWALGAHLSAVLLGFLGPLLVLLVRGPKSPFVRGHAVEALNFNISAMVYGIVAALLCLVLVGFILLPVIAIGWLVLAILAAVAASRGDAYRYPLTIRLVR